MPSEKLYASYNLCTTDGKRKSPSVAFTRLEKIFEYADVDNFKSAMIYDKEKLTVEAAAVRKAYQNISGATAKSILGDRLYLSQTQIKKFFHCPYSYYGSYVLGLRERSRAEIGTLNAGLFLHHVTEHFLRRTLDENNCIKPLDASETITLADEIITSYVTELCGDRARLGSIIHLFGRMRTVAISLINSIIAELSQSSFRPFGFEVKFGGQTESSPAPMTIDLDLSASHGESDPVRLVFGGTADRVDFYKNGDKVYIRVIDYKSSAHDIDFSEGAFEKDLNVQLLIYLFAMCSDQNKKLFSTNSEQILPASAMYVSYKENTADGTVDIKRTGLILDTDEILHATSAELNTDFLPGISFSGKDSSVRKGKALCPVDRLEELESELKNALSETARRLYCGFAERSPSDNACRFCSMNDSCPACVQSKNQF
jgi:ATP-dependent helicase/nuclease subunit B